MIKTNPAVKTDYQKKPYVKPAGLIIATGIGALNGIEKADGIRMTRVLSPLDDRLFKFLNKSKLGTKLVDFLKSPKITPDQYKNLGKTYRANTKLVLKGATFGAALYVAVKLIHKTLAKIGDKLNK